MTLVSKLENRIQVQTNLDVSYYDNDKIAFVCENAGFQTAVQVRQEDTRKKKQQKRQLTIKQAASKEFFI